MHTVHVARWPEFLQLRCGRVWIRPVWQFLQLVPLAQPHLCKAVAGASNLSSRAPGFCFRVLRQHHPLRTSTAHRAGRQVCANAPTEVPSFAAEHLFFFPLLDSKGITSGHSSPTAEGYGVAAQIGSFGVVWGRFQGGSKAGFQRLRRLGIPPGCLCLVFYSPEKTTSANGQVTPTTARSLLVIQIQEPVRSIPMDLTWKDSWDWMGGLRSSTPYAIQESKPPGSKPTEPLAQNRFG